MMLIRRRQIGFVLIELLVALMIASLVVGALAAIASQARASAERTRVREALMYDATFAMRHIVDAVQNTDRLMVPLADNVATTWREHVREQTVPASAPEPGSTRATAVLAVTLDPSADLDGDGFPDADNDRDGRIDEDPPADSSYDNAPGIFGIDDNGDGTVDENIGTANADDDETNGVVDEDPLGGGDDDGDGIPDEDPGADANGDGAPGVAGVDDDGDGLFDEGSVTDDDEDGFSDEDWWDAVVFYLNGDQLMQRIAVPWDEDASGGVDGRDYVETPLADNVTRLRFERVPRGGRRADLVDITVELTGADGVMASLNTRVRVGGTR